MFIRVAKPSDINNIIDVHLSSFENFFLSFLGKHFLFLLYTGFYREDVGVLLVAEQGRRIVGFVGGVTCQAGFYRNLLKRNFFSFALASFGAFLRRPSIAPRLFRAVLKSKASKKAASEACLMTIAVSPDAEGKGVGRDLVKAFALELKRRGCTSFCLTTDAVDNDRTNRFYQKSGLKYIRSFLTPENRMMNEYYATLNDLGEIK